MSRRCSNGEYILKGFCRCFYLYGLNDCRRTVVTICDLTECMMIEYVGLFKILTEILNVHYTLVQNRKKKKKRTWKNIVKITVFHVLFSYFGEYNFFGSKKMLNNLRGTIMNGCSLFCRYKLIRFSISDLSSSTISQYILPSELSATTVAIAISFFSLFIYHYRYSYYYQFCFFFL